MLFYNIIFVSQIIIKFIFVEFIKRVSAPVLK